MRTIVVLFSAFAAVSALPPVQRIVGGSLTTISQYPSAASLLYTKSGASYYQACAGTILTTRSILSAAHCFAGDYVSQWRVRVGSTYANSGGVVHNVGNIIFNGNTSALPANDIAILKTVTTITFVANAVQAANFAGAQYNLPDNAVVWAIGWGATDPNGSASELLRHVQTWIVPQATCSSRWAATGRQVSANMVCSGYLDYGGRDQCMGDGGGPLFHNGVVVGVSSWLSCGTPRYPSVNTRVSKYINWIQANA